MEDLICTVLADIIGYIGQLFIGLVLIICGWYVLYMSEGNV